MKQTFRKFLEARSKVDVDTKTDTRVNQDDIFNTRMDNVPALRSNRAVGDLRLNKANAVATADSLRGVQLNQRAMDILSSMDLSNLEDIEDDQALVDILNAGFDPTEPTTDNLPSVINMAVRAAGSVEPKFHAVHNLPGYASTPIRKLGRAVFKPFTDTRIEDICVVANLGGSGKPNTTQELNAIVGTLARDGTRHSQYEIDFDNSLSAVIPGYHADILLYTYMGYTFLVVRDEMGQYVYSWPTTDNKFALTDNSIRLLSRD